MLDKLGLAGAFELVDLHICNSVVCCSRVCSLRQRAIAGSDVLFLQAAAFVFFFAHACDPDVVGLFASGCHQSRYTC